MINTLYERIRLQAQLRRLIQTTDWDTALSIIAEAVQKELVHEENRRRLELERDANRLRDNSTTTR